MDCHFGGFLNAYSILFEAKFSTSLTLNGKREVPFIIGLSRQGCGLTCVPFHSLRRLQAPTSGEIYLYIAFHINIHGFAKSADSSAIT